MYKYLIVAVLFFIVGGAGYYFNTSGGGKLLEQAIAQDSKGVSSVDVFSGIYECTSESGCIGITKLNLKPDATAEIALVEEEETKDLGKGTWGVVHSGAIILLLEKPTNSSSSYPTSITIKQVSIMKLSNFSTKKKLFPGMFNPTFKRIGESEIISDESLSSEVVE